MFRTLETYGLTPMKLEEFKELLRKSTAQAKESIKEVTEDIKGNFETVTGTVTGPATDIIIDTETNVMHIEVATPGFAKEDITVELDGTTLTISGEFRKLLDVGLEFIEKNINLSNFSRKIELSPAYKNAKVQATYTNGILTISLTPVKKVTTKIEIK